MCAKGPQKVNKHMRTKLKDHVVLGWSEKKV